MNAIVTRALVRTGAVALLLASTLGAWRQAAAAPYPTGGSQSGAYASGGDEKFPGGCVLPTAVLLERFVARAEGNAVTLQFQLSEEAGVQGINIYRREAGTEDQVRVTDQPIAPDGHRTYTHTDRSVEESKSYTYELGVLSQSGSEVRMGAATVTTRAAVFALGRPSPNPSRLGFSVAVSSAKGGPAKLRLFDIAGRCVATIFDGYLTAGEHTLSWSARSSNGQGLGSGLLVLVFENGGRRATERVVLAR